MNSRAKPMVEVGGGGGTINKGIPFHSPRLKDIGIGLLK